MGKKYDYSLFQPGIRVRKKVRNPFKSSFLVNTIAALTTSPYTGLPAATFKEDTSIVDLRRLKPADEPKVSSA
jgi:hypothetical protein